MLLGFHTTYPLLLKLSSITSAIDFNEYISYVYLQKYFILYKNDGGSQGNCSKGFEGIIIYVLSYTI